MPRKGNALEPKSIPLNQSSNPLITAGTYPPITIDLVSNGPGMTPQREYREGGKLVWRDVVKDGQVVIAPVDIDALPFDVYRLIAP